MVSVEVSLALSSFVVATHGQGWTEQEMLQLFECAQLARGATEWDAASSSSALVRGVGGAAGRVVVTSRHASEAHSRCVRFGIAESSTPWIGLDVPRVPGITVRVGDLFCNVPVRQAATKARPSVEWERIRMVISQFALAFPQVAVGLRDLDAARVVLSVQVASSIEGRLLQLFGGTSVDVAMHRDRDMQIEVYIRVVRGAMQSSLRAQFVHVNGVPVSDADWLLSPLIAGLASGAAKGPQQMGAPRTFPVLLLEVRCRPDAVQLTPCSVEDTGRLP
jgi:DNA mismatch repair ATPase MutL